MLSVFIKTLILYVLLTLMMKIMGKRRIGELEPDELVSTLLISELAAMPISDPNVPLINSIVPILFIVALEVLLAALKSKSRKAKHLLEGEPSYIIYKGRLFPEVLTKNRISINELLSEMRSQGIGSIEDVASGIIEANGKLSLIQNGSNISYNIIVDGDIHHRELALAEKDQAWLQEQLRCAGLSETDILLFAIDQDDNIQIIKKEEK